MEYNHMEIPVFFGKTGYFHVIFLFIEKIAKFSGISAFVRVFQHRKIVYTRLVSFEFTSGTLCLSQ